MSQLDVFQKEPGVYMTEAASPPAPPSGVATGLAAMFGVAEWGPFGAVLCDSFTMWRNYFGEYISSKYPAYKQVKKFFKNGGQYLYFSRVVHYATGAKASAQASATLKDTASTPATRLTLKGKYDGAKGNSLTVDVDAGSNGVTGEFKLTVYLSGTKIESFDNLSLNMDANNYVVKVLANQSNYIVAEDSTSNVTALKTGVTGVTFAGGEDGLTDLVTDDYVGTAEALSGLHAFDVVEDCLTIGCPDEDVNTTVAIRKAMADYCDTVRPLNFAVITVPKGLGATAALDFYKTTLQIDSPRMAMYGPWLKDEDDGEIISPMGAILGVYTRFASDPQKGIWWSPAGLEATIKGFTGTELQFSSAYAGKLNESHYNVIKTIDGTGICIWGSRTLAVAKAADFKYIGARLNTSDLERRIYKNTQWAVHRPNDSILWAQVSIVVASILDRRFMDGGLDGDSPSEAYAVVCDKTNNNQTTRNIGLVACQIGIRNKQTAEFIWFNIAQLSSGGSVTEAA